MRTIPKGFETDFSTYGLKAIKTYGNGRRCKICKTLMSRFTEGKYCNAHARLGGDLEEERRVAHGIHMRRKRYLNRKEVGNV